MISTSCLDSMQQKYTHLITNPGNKTCKHNTFTHLNQHISTPNFLVQHNKHNTSTISINPKRRKQIHTLTHKHSKRPSHTSTSKHCMSYHNPNIHLRFMSSFTSTLQIMHPCLKSSIWALWGEEESLGLWEETKRECMISREKTNQESLSQIWIGFSLLSLAATT